MPNIETVHVVFKTHLDIGFTDLAANVVEQYRRAFIPHAIQAAQQLEAEGNGVKFVWTTGSWLIYDYLKNAAEDERRTMEEAIAKGWVVWHGLPFTTHTELMDPSLFDYGLSISKGLDRRFGKTTIAAKMTDVPGHTRAIVSRMATSGIRYLHLGVNGASKVPNVPEVFVWRDKDGAEMIVNYADNYGSAVVLDGMRDALVFAHTSDNCGPSTVADIKREFAALSAAFPGAAIRASTMDAFAEKLQAIKHTLPVVHEEIGDSWIHGVGTDPVKVSRFRELLRLRQQWLQQGRLLPDSAEFAAFSDELLMIPEHTWGMDEKKHLADYRNYAKADFRRARQADRIPEEVSGGKYSYLGHFQMDESDTLSERLFAEQAPQARSYRKFESSWQEQREYLHRAVRALSPDKQAEVAQVFASQQPSLQLPDQAESLSLYTPYSLGCATAEFGEDGSIVALTDRHGKVWADDRHRLGVVVYESFGIENYHTWFEQYMENLGKTHVWSDADYAKPGMEHVIPKPRHQLFAPHLTALIVRRGHTADCVYALLRMPEPAVERFGAPANLLLEYVFDHHRTEIQVDVQWFDKQANRLPEATWISFSPLVDNPNLWLMDKLGERVSPLEVVKNGNRNLHCVNSGLYYDGADGSAAIVTLDAPLVAPGERRLLQFDNTFAALDGGFHFALHNNVWGTNFPMWCEEDARFRFSLNLERLKTNEEDNGR